MSETYHNTICDMSGSLPDAQTVVPAFQTVGTQVQSLDNSTDEFEQSLVEEVESYCVNCEQNVSKHVSSRKANTSSGHYKASSYKNSLFS